MDNPLNMWQTLDLLYEDIERGLQSEESLFESEVFKCFSEKLREDVAFYDNAPLFLRKSELFNKHCAIINPNLSYYISTN